MEDTSKEKVMDFTLKNLLSLTMADIDIYLLQEEDQKTDKDKVFTVEEIRDHLEKTNVRMLNIFTKFGLDINKPIPTSFLPDITLEPKP